MGYHIGVGDATKHPMDDIEFKSVITDPMWPNCARVWPDVDPLAVFTQVMNRLPQSVERVTVVLGCDSDPRFLQAVPSRFPFFRTSWLRFCSPNRKGRVLYSALCAYSFGKPIPWAVGQRVIPGEVLSRTTEKRLTWHPTPMRVVHAKFLVRWFSDADGVLDPFAGSGSIGVACKELRRPYYGLEINPEWATKAQARIDETPEPFL